LGTIPSDPVDHGAAFIAMRPLDQFFRIEIRSSLLVLGATVAALVWANSAWMASYEVLWTTDLSVRVGESTLAKDLRHWVNNGLMTLFFLVGGLEISREVRLSKRRDWWAGVVPAFAALGGMVLAALFYLTVNVGGPAARGWPIALATDLALVLGLLTVVRRRCPPQLRAFAFVLVVVGNLAVIALLWLLPAKPVNPVAMAMAVALLAVVAVVRRLRVLRTFTYLVVAVALWTATAASGLHPAVVGVLLGVVLTVFPPPSTSTAIDAELSRLVEPDSTAASMTDDARALSSSRVPSQRLVELLHPWSSYLVLPLFALANAGVTLDRDLLARAVGSSLTLGVFIGLVAGKLLGILVAIDRAARAGLGLLPRLVTRRQLAAAAAATGIGFTMALFVADAVLLDRVAHDEATVGILAGSAAAATLAWLLFNLPLRPTGAGRRRGAGEGAAGGSPGGAGAT
jgi:Na+/H+ antiporter NhaA